LPDAEQLGGIQEVAAVLRFYLPLHKLKGLLSKKAPFSFGNTALLDMAYLM
jgi:hypothetical protein